MTAPLLPRRTSILRQDKSAALKDLRTMRNKGVLRLHERLSRDQAKRDEGDRGRRMEASVGGVWRRVWEG